MSGLAKNRHDNPWTVYRVMDGGNSRHVAKITCNICKDHHSVVLTKELPPEVIAGKFGEKRWAVEKSKAICPACIGRLRNQKRSGMNTASPAMTIRDLNPIEHRKVMALLEDYFDEKAGRYNAGKSDQTIADEVKCPRAAVHSLRERYFGPLKVDPEVAAVRDEIEKMLAKLADLSSRLDKLEKR